MKRLYLIRHGEAEDETDGTPDIKRKLLETGIKDTQKIVEYLNDQNVTPDCIFTSPAIRAFETAKLLAEGLNFPLENILCDKRLYGRDPDAFFDILMELDDSLTNVILVGHNPYIGGYASFLISDYSFRMVPSTAVGIVFKLDSWTKIKHLKGEKLFVVSPQSL